MILTVKVNASIGYAQEVKEILAMRLELLGAVQVIRIEDDHYGEQLGVENGSKNAGNGH